MLLNFFVNTITKHFITLEKDANNPEQRQKIVKVLTLLFKKAENCLVDCLLEHLTF